MKGYILALLLVVCLTTDFNISSTSTCTNLSATGFCTRWEQSGRVEEDYGSCFPADAQLMTP